jgi:hypothetical protein
VLGVVALAAGACGDDDADASSSTGSAATSGTSAQADADPSTSSTTADTTPTTQVSSPAFTTEELIAATPDAAALPGGWTVDSENGGVFDDPPPPDDCDSVAEWPQVQGSRTYTGADGRWALVVVISVAHGEGPAAFAHYRYQYGCSTLAGVQLTPIEAAPLGDETVAAQRAAAPDVPESALVMTRYGDLIVLVAANDPAGEHLQLAETIRPAAESALGALGG